ncbi:MAG TPA: Lrp/AsnC family transcriptional regulator [Miltoncostaeaceae bacterium]|nr:Lrp/AsnC family transcriptional regulator [Miltoncostaeaceae bacterium]
MIDDIDRQIVALLRENARRSFKDIGERVSLSAPAVKRRVDRLEAEGIIRGYAAVVDADSLGWPTRGIVALMCEGRMSAAEVRAAVAPHPEVSAAYTIAGQASAILHVDAAGTTHLEQTLERIRRAPGVRATETQIVLSTLFERPMADRTAPRRRRASTPDPSDR